MSQFHIFADEAGCFTFNRGQNVSRYFILCTISMRDCAVGDNMVRLRRQLARDGLSVGDQFHATEDRQIVRDRVYQEICKHEFTIQATIMEKSKSRPHIRESKPTFYKYGWYYHFKHGIARSLPPTVDLLVTAAAIGSRKERTSFLASVNDVIGQLMPRGTWQTDFCSSAVDPCVQVADYCAWAIQRKYERGDERSYDLIKDKITYEFDLWSRGDTHYY